MSSVPGSPSPTPAIGVTPDMGFDEFMDEWPCRICADEDHLTRAHEEAVL